MYSYIIGRITERYDNIITLECNGVGYEINVSSKAFSYLRDADGEIKVYTYYQVREDGVSLFGFYSKDEKDMFLNLITVSGVGPKGALTILSNIDVADLGVVIASQDVGTLSSVKGIGKKTAERLIVELKNKVTVTGDMVGKSLPIFNNGDNQELLDAVEVLCSLGLNRQDAMRQAQAVYESGDSAESIITKALASGR